ncbi:MAG: hypothetical protein GOMPHAMPRED_001805 [Gomphillus americanus]|uniref:F-box domain-containing protein n=1 Tax=Gomphillus americanus TaxID=1940652 RepID=A0A8H3IMT3_9LECA|nr:MAG: hypothetical protein GOMPHAMPRED_001805 [Gomphillus americanus]
MSLFGCPNEILKQIIHDVAIDDLENIAFTCRLIRELSGPVLEEHYKFKRKYGYKLNYPAKKSMHPAEILDAVIESPRAALYVRALSLTYRAPKGPNDKRIVAILEKHNYFWNLLNENPLIMDGEVYSWYARIQDGHIDAIYALLLYYLHSLKELRIQRPLLIPMTSVMISRLKCSIVHELWNDNPPDSSETYQIIAPEKPIQRQRKLGLARLERVIIDPATCSDEVNLRNRLGDFARFASFAKFPDLQHLNGISLCSRKYTISQKFWGFSNLRSIRLMNCHIDPDAFRSLFSGIKGLESFHYVPTVDAQESTQVVIDHLRQYAGHSLTRLYLRHSEVEMQSEAWKYRGFENLKRIDLNWNCLVHHETPKGLASSGASQSLTSLGPPPSPKKNAKELRKIHQPILVDLMPLSAESIKIVDLDGKANIEATRWLFFKLLKRIGHFPDLKLIIFVTPRRDCWLHAKEICSRVNLKFPAYSCEREKRTSEIEYVYE